MRSAALVVLLSVAAPGCDREERGECDTAHVDCPNEPAATFADRCRAIGVRGCADEDRALFRCLRDHQVCDGRGRLDVAASEALCAQELRVFGACVGADAAVDAPADTAGDAADDTVQDTAEPDATGDDAGADGVPG